jgi:hypothetical protein
VSVESKRNGQLRLRCNGERCDQKFVPLRPYTDPIELRKRAELYGWRTSWALDFCPRCGPQPNLEGVT